MSMRITYSGLKTLTHWGIKTILVLASLSLLSGCNSATPEPTQTPTHTPAITATINPLSFELTPVLTFTSTPTPIAGDIDNPVVLGVVYKDKARQDPAVKSFLQLLSDETGWVIQILEFDNTFDLLAAMDSGKVSFTWMLPLTYIYAHQNNISDILFVTKSYNLTSYGTQFLVRADSGYSIHFDPDTATTDADETTALRQFSGTRPCLLDETSLAGYVVPLGYMKMARIDVLEPIFMRTSTAVIRAVKAGEICSLGATYAIMGDPRTSSELIEDFPNILDDVVIAWRSEAVIPNLSLAVSSHLDAETVEKLAVAIEKFSSQPDGPLTLTTSTLYNIEGLERATDDIFDALREIVSASGIDLVNYLGN